MYKLYKRINKNLFLLIVIWILFGHGASYAQNNNTDKGSGFLGMIIDQFGRPVSGAEIAVKKSGFKTFSNEEGTFNLDPAQGNTIIVTHPAYMAKEIKLPQETLNKAASAQPDTIAFKIRIAEKLFKNPETIDVVYGTRDKKSFLGSEATIYTDQMTTTLSSNIIASFAGRLPGLLSLQTKGMRSSMVGNNYDLDIFVGHRPILNVGGYGDNTEFNVTSRGLSPIVVIDGVQRDFYSLDPENIESISIQKDALSTMSLGMRSSRPILVITTKKPVDTGFQISFTGKFGIQKPLKTLKPLSSDQYVYLLNEALQNDGKEAAYSYDDYIRYRDQTSPYTHPNTDWYDAVLRDHSTIQSYTLNANGGGKVAQYFVSLGYLEENGLFRSSKIDNYETNARLQRYLITSRVNINVTDDFKVDVSLMGRIEDGNQPGATTNEILSGVFETPNFASPVYNPNGTYGGNVSWSNNLLSKTINSGYIKDNRRDGMAAITMKYDFGKFVKGLSATIRGNITTQSISALERSKTGLVYEYTPSPIEGNPGSYEYFGVIKNQSNEFKSVGNYQQMYGQIAVDYQTSIGKHNISGGIFGDLREELLNYDLPKRPANLNMNAKYNYDMKYFAEISGSRSYFNRYRPGKRWGNFFAVGLGWDMSREDFLADADWLNQLKIRAVYGNTGNGVDNTGYYDWRQAYGSGNEYVKSYVLGYSYGKTSLTGVSEIDNKLSNWNLSWERAHKINIGADISLLNNKIQISADFYRDKYYDLLQTRGKSIELIGLNYPSENIGKNLFTGADISITYQDNIADFNYFVSANWSIQKGKVLFMDEQDTRNDFNRRTGHSPGVRFGYIADGFFKTQEEIDDPKTAKLANFDIRPGDLKFADLDNNGVIDEFDQTVIANDKPISYFGFNLGFEYHGFEVSALVQGVYNRDIYLPDAGFAYVQPFFGKSGSYSQAYENALGRWTPETAETATFPRLNNAGSGVGFGLLAGYNTKNESSFWVKSGNFIRLKNVSVAYTLPDSFSRNYLGGLRIKIFVNGQNLLTKSSYEDLDPEVLNFASYPNMRGFNTGINIKF